MTSLLFLHVYIEIPKMMLVILVEESDPQSPSVLICLKKVYCGTLLSAVRGPGSTR